VVAYVRCVALWVGIDTHEHKAPLTAVNRTTMAVFLLIQGCFFVVKWSRIHPKKEERFMDQKEARLKAHNDRLLEELRNGYCGCPVPVEEYFYPPRPIIKKDKDALEFVHRKKAKLGLAEES